MAVAIHPARAEDVPAIDALLRAGFPALEEAELVRDLCRDGDMVLTLVAHDDATEALAGAVMFSRMDVTVAGTRVPSVALAPLAVAAPYRRQGVAEALVRAGHDRLRAEGVALSFVLGEPEYYGRFGYCAAVARGFASPYAGEYFMALPLREDDVPSGAREAACHAPAFSRLGSQ